MISISLINFPSYELRWPEEEIGAFTWVKKRYAIPIIKVYKNAQLFIIAVIEWIYLNVLRKRKNIWGY